MISVEEAGARVLAAVEPLPPIELPLRLALGSFTPHPIFSPIDLPLFDNSAMDGYAVRSEDLQGATPVNPKILGCEKHIPAGQNAGAGLHPGKCARLFTGSALPPGANAVVMQEDVTVREGSVSFHEPVKPLENVRLCGEDVRRGALLLGGGERLTAAGIGVLAATGQTHVTVHRRARVALLATGNELVEAGRTLALGEIYESNRSMISALLTQVGAEIQVHPIVRDEKGATVAALSSAFEWADLVISSGGVSVGEYDFVREAFGAIGGAIDLWQIAMRPGKPFTFGRIGGKFLFGLPGNPVSAFVTFLVLVRPALLKMHGAGNSVNVLFPGELMDPIMNGGDRRHYVRVRWENGQVYLAGPQKSHLIGALVRANALLDVPPREHWLAGRKVKVVLWELP